MSASEANRSFSALLRQVAQGRSFTVHSHGRPVASLTPVSDADLVVPLQCLGELFRVLTGKAGRSADQARDAVLGWMDAFPVLESNATAWRGAMDLCVAHQLASWDALVLTEDLHAGFCWRWAEAHPIASPRSSFARERLI